MFNLIDIWLATQGLLVQIFLEFYVFFQVSAAGYASQSVPISVTEGNVLIIDVTLERVATTTGNIPTNRQTENNSRGIGSVDEGTSNVENISRLLVLGSLVICLLT